MTFEEFLAYVREHVGSYCKDTYWRAMYDVLEDKSLEGVRKEMPFMAVQAIGTDYATKHSCDKIY